MQQTPQWTDSVLQGVAYWIGYKKQYYPFYPLTEGAIAGELLALLFAHLEKSKRLDAEVMYKKLCKGWKEKERINSRADIVISYKDTNDDYEVDSVIEIKRNKSSVKAIKKDLQRLAQFALKKNNPDARAFLLLVSQGKLPKDFVSKNGNAKHKLHDINGYPQCYARVRRVCKATNKFDTNTDHPKAAKNANYACLIEVFLKEGEESS